jgi:hypothetical protein
MKEHGLAARASYLSTSRRSNWQSAKANPRVFSPEIPQAHERVDAERLQAFQR